MQDVVRSFFLDEHVLYLHYRVENVSLGDRLEKSLGDWTLACSGALPELQSRVLADQGRGVKIWENVAQAGTRPAISDDLGPELAQLLSGKDKELSNRWTMSQDALKFFQDGYLAQPTEMSDQRNRIGLVCKLNKRASERLRRAGVEECGLWISLQSVDLTAFGTDLSFMVAGVRIERMDGAALSTMELQEAANALCRVNRCGWASRHTNEMIATDSLSLGQVLRPMIQDKLPAKLAGGRVVSYTYARLKEHQSTDTLDTLAKYFARRYSSDYHLDTELASIEMIREFTNIRHAVAQEGIATVSSPGPETADIPQFLRDWRATTLEPAYLPITLLLLHENWFLDDLQSQALRAPKSKKDLELLEETIRHALAFRLFYRFASMGGITMHNALAVALRKVWGLDRRLSDMELDVGAMRDDVRAQRQAESAVAEQNRSYTIETLGLWSAAALTGLSVFTIAKEVQDAIAKVSNTGHWEDWVHFVPVAIGVVFGLGSLSLGYWLRGEAPPESKGSKHTKRALRGQMLRRARSE